ncbi:MAG TPA: hypothetical protein VFM18_10995 [Methanosarcina sp.]|nr:hypothetical protein [Methanosarcina sp.]
MIAHSEDIVLQDVVPSVRQSGLQKLRESGVRNVHAFLTGLWLPENATERARLRNAENGVPVWYDPFRHGAFINSEGGELLYADRVICSSFNQTPSLIAVGGEFSD